MEASGRGWAFERPESSGWAQPTEGIPKRIIRIPGLPKAEGLGGRGAACTSMPSSFTLSVARSLESLDNERWSRVTYGRNFFFFWGGPYLVIRLFAQTPPMFIFLGARNKCPTTSLARFRPSAPGEPWGVGPEFGARGNLFDRHFFSAATSLEGNF